MFQLQDFFLQAGLFDLRYLGPCHTWTNKQLECPIAKKLDRLLVNSSSISAHPHVVATFLPSAISDHTPYLLNLAYSLPKAGTYPYKFSNYLTKHPGFTQLIKDAWINSGRVSHTLTQLCWKLKKIKSDLKRLNKEIIQIFKRASLKLTLLVAKMRRYMLCKIRLHQTSKLRRTCTKN